MPTYAGPGLLAGPYWDAIEPDPANPFQNNDATQGVLGMSPEWAEPMTPSWPAVDFLPWQRFIPIDQAPDDFGPLLPPGLKRPPWWLRPAPSIPPLLPPWAYPPPDVPRLPPVGLEPGPKPPRLPWADDPDMIERYGRASPEDLSFDGDQPFYGPAGRLDDEPIFEQPLSDGVLDTSRVAPFFRTLEGANFTNDLAPTAFVPLDPFSAWPAQEPTRTRRFELPEQASETPLTTGLADPYGPLADTYPFAALGSYAEADQPPVEPEPWADSLEHPLGNWDDFADWGIASDADPAEFRPGDQIAAGPKPGFPKPPQKPRQPDSKPDQNRTTQEPPKEWKPPKLPENKSILGHIFTGEGNHLPDTPENRQIVQETVSDWKNFVGRDRYGKEWYARTLENGRQVWVEAYNGEIRNGGVNPVPRQWNPDTGFASPFPKR